MKVQRYWSLWWLGEIELSFRRSKFPMESGNHRLSVRAWVSKYPHGRYIGTEVEVGRFRLFLARSPYDDHQGEF